MEEILIVILQAIGELILQVVIYLPFEWPRSSRLGERESGSGSGCGWALLYLGLGALIGWLSVLVVSHVMLPRPWLRIANLVAAPLACGWTSYWFAKWRQSQGRLVDPAAHFFSGAMFALGFVVVRFVAAHR